MSFAEMGGLGGISVSAISKNKKRSEESLRKDFHLRESFQRLSKELRSKLSQKKKVLTYFS
jgi:hypothetical protein